MGDEILMKSRFFLVSLLLASILSADASNGTKMPMSNGLKSANIADTSEFDEKFDELTKTREGLKDDQMTSIKNPFPIVFSGEKVVALGDQDQAASVGFELTAIVGNKVKVNRYWYGIGDYIGVYKLVKVNKNSAIIANDANSIELKLKQGNKNVIITYK